MILAVDIGNTTTALGLFETGPGMEVRNYFRVPTQSGLSEEQYKALLESMPGFEDLAGRIKGVIISSVVPEVTGPLRRALVGLLHVTPRTIGEEVNAGMPLLVDKPGQIGADRVVNAVAAFEIYGGPVIVVDFGTAITFDYINRNGEFKGGAIAPGISTSIEALSERASMLPLVEVKRPAKVVGTNTEEAIRSGVYWGFTGLVDGIIERMKGEVGSGPKVVATGGAAHLVASASSSIEEVDELLTLKGLKILCEGV
jgi:type III pantothenate kinase